MPASSRRQPEHTTLVSVGHRRGGFLSAEDRRYLIALARDGSAASRLTRRPILEFLGKS
jgi:hypothetical protein